MSAFLYCFGDIEFGRVKRKEFLDNAIAPPVDGLEADTVSELITEAHDEIGLFFSVTFDKKLRIRAVVTDDWWDLAVETMKALAHVCAALNMEGSLFAVDENGEEGTSFDICSGKVNTKQLVKDAAVKALDDMRVCELINILQKV
jgi:hypothetical protein